MWSERAQQWNQNIQEPKQNVMKLNYNMDLARKNYVNTLRFNSLFMETCGSGESLY